MLVSNIVALVALFLAISLTSAHDAEDLKLLEDSFADVYGMFC